MAEYETEPEPLPPYVGTGPKDRVRAFLDAVAASRAGRGAHREFEPRGLLGWRGADGYYHDLTEGDLWALLGDGAPGVSEIGEFLATCLKQDEAAAKEASGATVVGTEGNWKPAPGGDEWEAAESADGDEEVLVALRPKLPRPPDVMGGYWGQVVAGPERYDEDDASAMAYFRHMAAHDPARVLRGVAATRAILRHVATVRADAERAAGGLTPGIPLAVQAAVLVAMRGLPGVIEKLLAAQYADRPGFKPEWRLDD